MKKISQNYKPVNFHENYISMFLKLMGIIPNFIKVGGEIFNEQTLYHMISTKNMGYWYMTWQN